MLNSKHENEDGSESVTKCNQLKMEVADVKQYLTEVANYETLLRLIQSIPSPKAEPIKLWLSRVDYESMQTAFASEKVLAKDWNSKEEDEAWKNL